MYVCSTGRSLCMYVRNGYVSMYARRVSHCVCMFDGYVTVYVCYSLKADKTDNIHVCWPGFNIHTNGRRHGKGGHFGLVSVCVYVPSNKMNKLS